MDNINIIDADVKRDKLDFISDEEFIERIKKQEGEKK